MRNNNNDISSQLLIFKYRFYIDPTTYFQISDLQEYQYNL